MALPVITNTAQGSITTGDFSFSLGVDTDDSFVTVLVAQRYGAASGIVGVTCGGVAMTREAVNGTYGIAYVYTLSGVSSGSKTIAVDTLGASSGRGVTAFGVTMTGVAEAGYLDSSANLQGSSNNNLYTDITTVADDVLVLSVLGTTTGSTPSINGTGHVSLASGTYSGGIYGFGKLEVATAGVNSAIGWTTTGQTNDYALTLAGFKGVGAAPTDVKNSSLATDLVSYWELEEASGTRVDSHGANDLTDNNTVTSATGIQGDGADFERSNTEYLSVADNASLSINSDMSISAWVKIETQVTSGTIEYNFFNKYLSTGNQRTFGLAYIYNGGTYALQAITSANGSSISFGNISQTLTPGTWYHIVWLYDKSAGSIEIYVDGSSIGTISSLSTSLYDSTAPFEIGAQNGAYTFDGVIDEVGLYERLLTPSDITTLYASGAGLPYEAAAAPASYSLTVNASKVAATLTDYPAYVDLSEMPASFWASVTNGGGDIRCYSDSGLTTELAREVVSCDTVTDTGEMHVKVPSLTTSSVIYVTVDGTSTEPAVGATYGRNAVWSDYTGVWHLQSDGVDSTDIAVDATISGATNGAGIIGNDYDFDGANDYIDVKAGLDDVGASGTALTVQAWFNGDTFATDFRAIWDSRDTTQRFYMLTTTGSSLFVGFLNTAGDAGVSLSTGTDYMLHFAYDGSTEYNLYLNGINEYTNSSVTAATYPSDEIYLGGEQYKTRRYFDGNIDEFRFRSGELASTWITTEYNNQSDVATFWTIAEEGGGGGATANNATFFGGGM